MKLFGKKKESKPSENIYECEIFGGFTITRKPGGYEIMWKSPNVTTISVQTMPVISSDVQTREENGKIHVLTTECKLKLITREGKTETRISKI